MAEEISIQETLGNFKKTSFKNDNEQVIDYLNSPKWTSSEVTYDTLKRVQIRNSKFLDALKSKDTQTANKAFNTLYNGLKSLIKSVIINNSNFANNILEIYNKNNEVNILTYLPKIDNKLWINTKLGLTSTIECLDDKKQINFLDENIRAESFRSSFVNCIDELFGLRPEDKVVFRDLNSLDIFLQENLIPDAEYYKELYVNNLNKMYEELSEPIRRRKKVLDGLKDFNKSQKQKGNWRKNRHKIQKGIDAFHRSTEGRRFHKKLARYLRNKEQVQEALVSLSSLQTYLLIEQNIFHDIETTIQLQQLSEILLPAINESIDSLWNGQGITEENADKLLILYTESEQA